MTSKAVPLLLVVVMTLMCVSCAELLSEADFRRMKIKDLRTFLDDRGLTCSGCQEKSDFVRVAFQNREKKPLGSAEKRPVPKSKFWDAWSSNAKSECSSAVSSRGSDPSAEPFASICEAIEKASESFFMQHGKRIAARLKKTADHMLKTSYKDVYYDAGLKLFRKLSSYCLASPAMQSKCASLGFVMDAMENGEAGDFKGWTTNVGIENTNPMYEILHGNDDL